MTQEMEKTMSKLAETINKATPEKQKEARIYLEGYLAGLERSLEKAEAEE